MSMTGAPSTSSGSTPGVSLQAVIEAARRLDELSTARVIGEAADAVHKAQKGGQPLGTLMPQAIVVAATGISLVPPATASIAYTAPEKLRGQAGDRRSDVFSLGVVLWEALAHERLFDAATDDDRKKAVLEREFQPPSELNANVPAELDAICKKALDRDPANRYQSAKVMAAEISAVLDDAGYPDTNDEIASYLTAAFPDGPPVAPSTIGAAIAAKLASAPASAAASTRQQLNQTMHGMAPLREPAPPEPAKPDAKAEAAKAETARLEAAKVEIARAEAAKAEAAREASAKAEAAKVEAAAKASAAKAEAAAKADAAKAEAARIAAAKIEAVKAEAAAKAEAAKAAAAKADADRAAAKAEAFAKADAAKAAAAAKAEAAKAEAAAKAAAKADAAKAEAAKAAAKVEAAAAAKAEAAAKVEAAKQAKIDSSKTLQVGSGLSLDPGKTIPAGSGLSASDLAKAVESERAKTPSSGLSPTAFMKPAVEPPAATPSILGAAPSTDGPPAMPEPDPKYTTQPGTGIPSVPPAVHTATTAVNPPTSAMLDALSPAPAKPQATIVDEPKPQALIVDEPPAKATLSTAETIATPALVAGLPSMPPGANQSFNDDFSTNAGAKPFVETPVVQAPNPIPAAAASVQTVDPSAAVSLPRPRSSTRPGTDKGTGKHDVLGDWGFSTDSHAAIDDGGHYEEDAPNPRKRLLIAVGGSLGAILLIVIIAVAASGGGDKKPKEEPPIADTSRTAEPVAKAADPAAGGPAPIQLPAYDSTTQPQVKITPAAADTAKVEPAAVDTAKIEPAAVDTAKVEPAAVDTAAIDTAKVEPAAVDTAKVEAENLKVAKAEAAKAEAARAETAKLEAANLKAAKAETAKAEAANLKVAKAEAAKIETAKAEAAKLDAANARAAKAETARLAKIEAANAAAAKNADAARLKAEKAEAARLAKAARVETPKTAKVETPKTPKIETPKTPKEPKTPKIATTKAKPIDPYAPEKASKVDPSVAYKTGFQQYVRGDTGGALTTFKSSLASNPGYPATWRGLGLVYEKMGQKAQAKKSFLRYLQLSPNASDAENIRGRMEKL